METILSKYGWTCDNNIVSNSLGKQVFTIKHKGSKYTFFDMANNKLMSGNGQLEKSLERILTTYYYCKPL